MVVDDQPDTRFLIKVILGDHDDIEVVAEAEGAVAALEALDGAAPDVALVDARMPLVDGYELTRELSVRAPRLRVALMTSIVDDIIEAQARIAGAVMCVSKGDLDALPDIVRGLRAP